MNANLSLSTISLVEFRNNPFCAYYIIDALVNTGRRTLADAAVISMEDAMSIKGFGKGKVAQLLAFRDFLISETETVIAFYESSIRTNVIGSSSGLSMASRISSMLVQLSDCLEAAGAQDLAVICREHLLKNRTITEIAADRSLGFSVTRERLRQKATALKQAIWTNGLSKYRVDVDESFLDDLALLRCSCAGGTVAHLLSSLGEGSVHGFTNVLGLVTVKSDLYPAVSLSEDYVIPSELGVRDFIDDMNAVVEQLHNEVRPSSLSDITAMASGMRSSLTEDKVAVILSSNSLCEKMDGLWQLRYDALCDYEKIARIIWERRNLHYRDVDMYHTIKTDEARQISHNLGVTQSKFPWCRPVGKTGMWEYCEQGVAKADITTVIREYVESHEVFSFSKALDYVCSLGFGYPEKTVRAYFMNECRTSVDNCDLLVAESKAASHPECTWRKKKTVMEVSWALSVIADHVGQNGPSRVCDLARSIVAADSEGLYTYRSAENFIYNTLRLSDALMRDEQGLVSINPDREPSREDLPAHYQAVLSTVKARVMKSPERMCSLRSLRDACEKIIAPFAQTTLFYKIVSEHCPEDLTRVYVDGKAYLRLAA